MTKKSTAPPPRGGGRSYQDEFADLDAREALFTGALAQADRVANRASAMRRQVMLAGFDAMVWEEQQQGRPVRMGDMLVRAFLLHQATVLRLPRQTVERQLTVGRTLRDRLPATWAAFLSGDCSETAAGIAADESVGLDGDGLAAFDAAAARLVPEEKPGVLIRKLAILRDRLNPRSGSRPGERPSTPTTAPSDRPV